MCEIGHDQGFGQLEFQAVRIDPGGRQDFLGHGDEIGLDELARADIDRERQVARHRIALPGSQFHAGRGQHPAADIDNQAGFLGLLDEVGEVEDVAVRLAPAQERLGPDHAAVAVELRLVVQDELPVAQRPPQAAFQFRAGGPLGLHVGVEKAEGIPAGRLGLVHRRVGLLGGRCHRVGGAADHRHADTGRDRIGEVQPAGRVCAWPALDREQQCDLLYFDESGFSLNPPIQYGWTSIGQTRSVEPLTHRQRVNVLGALRHKGQLIWTTQQRPTVRDDVIAFFDQIAAPVHSVPCIALLDNAAIHKGDLMNKKRRQWTKQGLHLYYLPPYSPELNRIEILWKHAKYFWWRFAAVNSAQLLEEIQSLMNDSGKTFTINLSDYLVVLNLAQAAQALSPTAGPSVTETLTL